jgi:glycosyltransferase involved in cell wall biosynthesis
VVTTTVVNFANFLFQLMVARILDPSAFGAMAALLGLILIFEVPANALQVLVAREVSGAHSRRAGTAGPVAVPVGGLIAGAVLWGAAVCVTFVFAAPLLESFLHLPSLTTAALVALDVVPIAIAAVPRGVLLGEQRYVLLGVGLVAGAVVKVGLGTLLVHHGLGIEGAMAAIVVGELVTAALLLPAMRGRATDGQPTTRRVQWRGATGPATAYTGYWLLTGVDLILGRHFLPPDASGLYAAAATVAQMVLILPGAVAAFVLPRLMTPATRHARRTLVHAVATIAVLQLVVAGTMIVGAHWIVAGLFGGQYASSTSIVVILTAAGAALGVVVALLQFDLARQIRLPAGLAWLGVAVIVGGTSAWHSSSHDIATTVVIACLMVMAGMLVLTFGSARPADDVAEQAQLALLEADLDLTVVVPYYNPGALLVPNLRRLLEVLDRSDSTFEVIAVCDGSTDGSQELIGQIDDPRLISVVLPRNQGKGAALRIGMGQGRGRWLGFLDADGDLDPTLLEPFQALVRLYDPEIVLGSKRHPLSDVDYPRTRRVYSWGYQRVVHSLFKLDLRDTQTGIKLIRRDVLAAVLPRMAEKRFAFDLELFVIARRLGYRRFFEAPIRLRHQFSSTVSWRSVVRTLRDTLTIFYRLRILRWYDEPLPAQVRSNGSRLEMVRVRGAVGTSPARRESAHA